MISLDEVSSLPLNTRINGRSRESGDHYVELCLEYSVGRYAHFASQSAMAHVLYITVPRDPADNAGACIANSGWMQRRHQQP